MKFIKKKLKNGITLIVEQREIPVVSLSITNKFGAAHETSSIKGIAHVIEHLVFTGTKTRTHEQISKEIERHGGVLNAFTTNDLTSFFFKLPSQHLFIGLDIITDIMNNPSFNEEKFEKEKKVIIEEIKMYHDTPTRYVYDQILKNLYSSPLGEGIIGSEKTINSLKRDFVIDYFKKKYNPSNYIVTAVGKVDVKKLINYLEKNFKANKSSSSPQKISKINRQTTEVRKGIDQSHFIFAIHAPEASKKEHYALEVLDAHLTSGMSSKLFLKIREELGLAYSIRGGLTTEKTHSYYSIYVGTRKEAIPKVKKIILEEFEKIKNITNSEVQQAKEKLIGLHTISKEESSEVMSELLFSELTGKAEDYYKREKNISQVKISDVKKLAKIRNFSTASIVPE